VIANQVLRPTSEVRELRLGHVNAQSPIECGEHISEMDGPSMWFLAPTRCRTENLTAPQSAPGQECAANIWPMVSAGVSVDLRCAAKLAPGNDRNVVQQTSFVQILDQ
jgi:hypothetical protein